MGGRNKHKGKPPHPQHEVIAFLLKKKDKTKARRGIDPAGAAALGHAPYIVHPAAFFSHGTSLETLVQSRGNFFCYDITHIPIADAASPVYVHFFVGFKEGRDAVQTALKQKTLEDDPVVLIRSTGLAEGGELHPIKEVKLSVLRWVVPTQGPEDISRSTTQILGSVGAVNAALQLVDHVCESLAPTQVIQVLTQPAIESLLNLRAVLAQWLEASAKNYEVKEDEKKPQKKRRTTSLKKQLAEERRRADVLSGNVFVTDLLSRTSLIIRRLALNDSAQAVVFPFPYHDDEEILANGCTKFVKGIPTSLPTPGGDGDGDAPTDSAGAPEATETAAAPAEPPTDAESPEDAGSPDPEDAPADSEAGPAEPVIGGTHDGDPETPHDSAVSKEILPDVNGDVESLV